MSGFRVTVPAWVHDLEPASVRYQGLHLEPPRPPTDGYDAGEVVVATRSAVEPLPLELVIREFLRLDLDDSTSVLAFCGDFGVTTNSHPFQPGSAGDELVMPFGRLRGDLAGLQRAADAWIRHKKGKDIRLAYQHDPAGPVGRHFDDDGLPTAATCWRAIAGTLNLHLSRHQPRIDVVGPGLESGLPRLFDMDLGAGLALELAQLIREDPRVRTCPVCGGWWVRHRGRARRGQHRTTGGVKYCSARCASRQSSREARDRAKESGNR